jgi:hypothetical protein
MDVKSAIFSGLATAMAFGTTSEKTIITNTESDTSSIGDTSDLDSDSSDSISTNLLFLIFFESLGSLSLGSVFSSSHSSIILSSKFIFDFCFEIGTTGRLSFLVLFIQFLFY